MKKRIFAFVLCAALLALTAQASAATALEKYLDATLPDLSLTAYQENSEGDSIPPAEYVSYLYSMRFDDTLGISPKKVTTSKFGTNSIEIPMKLFQALAGYGVNTIAYDTGEMIVYLPTNQENTWVGANGSVKTSVWKADTKPKNCIGSAWMVLNDESEYGFGLEFRTSKKYKASALALAFRLDGETKWRKIPDAKFEAITYASGTKKNTYYYLCTNYADLADGAYALVTK